MGHETNRFFHEERIGDHEIRSGWHGPYRPEYVNASLFSVAFVALIVTVISLVMM